MKLSTRNRLTGTVTGVAKGEAVATVHIDCGGQQIVSSITREAAEELGLSEGSRVTALIKASDVMLATDFE
jgi:molybdopterin-binding protein